MACSDAQRTRYSKSLSWLLRHGAVEAGLKMSDNGYIKVADILKLPQFRGLTVDMLREIVKTDSKTRFTLQETGDLAICANQGHSLAVENLSLRPITTANDCPQAIHGTFERSMGPILRGGLKPMSRQHIHFSKVVPTADRDVSGIRRTCDVLIYLDVEKALLDAIPLFESDNGVILSPGNASGCIPRTYFLKVVDRQGSSIRRFERKENESLQ